jgi:hypothetical protein
MKKIKVLIDFTGRPTPQKIVFYKNVIDKLTGNQTFPNPDVTLNDAKAAIDALEVDYLAARDGGGIPPSQTCTTKKSSQITYLPNWPLMSRESLSAMKPKF